MHENGCIQNASKSPHNIFDSLKHIADFQIWPRLKLEDAALRLQNLNISNLSPKLVKMTEGLVSPFKICRSSRIFIIHVQ